MDPLSITTAVVTLAGVCLTTTKRMSDLRIQFNLTSVTLVSILSETTVVSASLGQIQTALLRFAFNFPSHFERDSTLLQTLDTALNGCSVVVLALQEEIDKLEAGLLKARINKSVDQVSPSWLLRIKVLWKEDIMKELLAQIRGQQASLGFLLQALNLDSMTELHKLIASNSSMLNQLTENTSKLCKAYPSIRDPRSIFEVDREDGVSFFSHVATSAGATEFDFDNFLVGSKVYRRAFMGGYLKPRRFIDTASDKDGGDTGTVIDIYDAQEAEEKELVPETTYTGYSYINQRSDHKFTTLAVKTAAGEVVSMNTEMVEELLQKHYELAEQYQIVMQHYEDVKLLNALHNQILTFETYQSAPEPAKPMAIPVLSPYTMDLLQGGGSLFELE